MKMNHKGSILIFSLWILMILTIFVSYIGLRVGDRIKVIGRIEDRSKLRHATQACINKSIALIRSDLRKEGGKETAYGKFLKYNNTEMLSKIHLGDVQCDIEVENNFGLENILNNGVVDEESKINLNFVDRTILRRLVGLATGIDDQQANFLAEVMIDWKEAGESDLKGFDSDNYYLNLKNPYQPKNAFYESVDELLLVYGMNQKFFDQLKSYVTVYGNGQININTASPTVLKSLGLDDRLVDKIVSVRRGVDAEESTVDDYVFTKTYDISSEIKKFIEMEDWETKQIDALNDAGHLRVDASIYKIISKAKMKTGNQIATAECVYNSKADRIENYREKF